MRWKKGSPLSQVTSKQETESTVASTYYKDKVVRTEVTNFLRINSKLILKGAPGKEKWELVAGILSSVPYLYVQTLGISRVVMHRQQLKIAFFLITTVYNKDLRLIKC